MKKINAFFLFTFLSVCVHAQPQKINLNGLWDMGYGRNYTQIAEVPGFKGDGGEMSPDAVWYRRIVKLPKGNWSSATLELKGARFLPKVYVNGRLVSSQDGGMAPTFHRLADKDVKPGKEITLEIELQSLKDVDPANASYVALADHWRNNIASYLWDDVVLQLHGDAHISRIIPFTDTDNKKVDVKYEWESFGNKVPRKVRAILSDLQGNPLAAAEAPLGENKGTLTLFYGDKLKLWSPESPNLYRLTLELLDGDKIADSQTISYAPKKFEVKDKKFYLNGEEYSVRAGTVVWPRFIRNEEAQEVGTDIEWFTKNVVMNLKERGANTLRFHMYNPPEKFIDLCDSLGLLVQYEWLFFHGLPSPAEQLEPQWRSWLDLAMKHPSVSIYQAYNETDKEEQDVAWGVLDKLLKEYPSLCFADRDQIHIHKYWWGLFENLGCYYDSYEQFPKAVMVDEFGGNYLDGYGNPGGYPTLRESGARFLGRNQTPEGRLAFQAQANCRVAEYWRRLGAAGFSPVFICSSWEDGNHWFLGKLKDGKPKPVWNALTAAYSPQSVSLEIWDRNFSPEQQVKVPLYFFNDTKEPARLDAIVRIADSNGRIYFEKNISQSVGPLSRSVVPVTVNMPAEEGDFVLTAELLNRPETVKYPVISSWEVHTLTPRVPKNLKGVTVGVPAEDTELAAFLKKKGIPVTDLASPKAQLIVTSSEGWKKIAENAGSINETLKKAIDRGVPVLILDAGPLFLGQGYPKEAGDLGPLQAAFVMRNGQEYEYDLFGGIKLKFTEIAEPDSHVHLNDSVPALGYNLPAHYNWLWNGYRGGLVAPAVDMEITGLNSASYLNAWAARGADPKQIQSNSYYAYHLQGFYAFSKTKNDKKCTDSLRKRVKFLVADAPALAVAVNPNASIVMTDLAAGYKDSARGTAESQVGLLSCGKGLTRMPACLITFGKGKGNLVVSQLLTNGRLSGVTETPGLYDVRGDVAAEQLVLNLMSLAMGSLL